MSRPLAHPTGIIPTEEELAQYRLELARALRAPRTLLGYASDWKAFTAWCKEAGHESLPACTSTVALYLTDRLSRGYKITSAARFVSAIRWCHRQAGHESPCTREVYALLTGAQRIRCEQPDQKTPLTVDQLRQILGHMTEARAEVVRNRAILLFGFATALRRSNLCALDMADLRFLEGGVSVLIRREKQDQKGIGRVLGVVAGAHSETCPVKALRAWLDVRGDDKPGPVFTQTVGRGYVATLKRLNPNRIGVIVQKAVASVGLDPRSYAAHSLRSGFVTEAIENGVGEFVVAAQTGHRSLVNLRRYFRSQDPFRGNPVSKLGL